MSARRVATKKQTAAKTGAAAKTRGAAPGKKSFYQMFLRGLIYLLPPVLFCSYYPQISLGSDATMNFEFSLPEIWLVVFFVATLPLLKRACQFYRASHRTTRFLLLLATFFVIYAGLSLLWSENFTRGLLTFGLLGLTVWAAAMIYFVLATQFERAQKWLVAKILLGSGVFFAVVCWLQSILDVCGVERSVTLLCQGCTYSVFGFPHPSGLAIESQFMGNLLLAPTLLALYLAVRRDAERRWVWVVLSLFLITTLFFVFSRGAIYAFAIALALMLVGTFVWQYDRQFVVASRLRQKYARKQGRDETIAAACKNKKTLYNKPNTRPNRGVENVENFSRIWLLIVLPLGGFALALTAQGAMAAVSATNDTFLSGVTKSIHQLTLGVVDWRVEPATTEEASDAESATEDAATEDGAAVEGETSAEATTEATTGVTTESESRFDGYAEESTNVRLNLNGVALDVWDDSSSRFLAGVGLGGAGVALSEKTDELSAKEIVQNQYVSILLELGVVGAVIFAIVIIYLYRVLARQVGSILLMALVTAYLVSLLFFSGLPNALHIYLLPALLIGVLPICGSRAKISNT